VLHIAEYLTIAAITLAGVFAVAAAVLGVRVLRRGVDSTFLEGQPLMGEKRQRGDDYMGGNINY
jgi:hypothetical protein